QTMNLAHPEWPKTLVKRPLHISLPQSPHSTNAYIGMPYTLYADGAEIQKGILTKEGINTEQEISTSLYKVVLANGQEFSIPVVSKFEEGTRKARIGNQGFHPYKDAGNRSPLENARQYADLVNKANQQELEDK
ncbi:MULTISPECIES: hypothetical protein, partial [unclassified Neisseria]